MKFQTVLVVALLGVCCVAVGSLAAPAESATNAPHLYFGVDAKDHDAVVAKQVELNHEKMKVLFGEEFDFEEADWTEREHELEGKDSMFQRVINKLLDMVKPTADSASNDQDGAQTSQTENLNAFQKAYNKLLDSVKPTTGSAFQ